jgi:L-lactate dehydrogenase complex protein LldG
VSSTVQPEGAAAVAAFAEQVPATGAVLHRCAGIAAARTAVAEILSSLAETAGRDSGGQPTVAATEAAVALLPDGIDAATAARHLPYLDLAVSTAVLGVAETGSLLLAPRTRWDRLLGILARVHAVAVDEDDVRPSLDDVATSVAAADLPYLSLVTGPTRTADIERVITIGAHGPAAVHVLLIARGAHA